MSFSTPLWSRQRKLGDRARGCDPADLASVRSVGEFDVFGKPQGAVRAGRDLLRRTACTQTRGKLGNFSVGVNPADPTTQRLREPHTVVRPGGYADWIAARPQGELDDRAGHTDAPDSLAGLFGEPHVAIRALGDPMREAARVRERVFGRRLPGCVTTREREETCEERDRLEHIPSLLLVASRNRPRG